MVHYLFCFFYFAVASHYKYCNHSTFHHSVMSDAYNMQYNVKH